MKDTNPSDCLWVEIADLTYWDHCITELGGHPMQTSLWGKARKHVDNIECRYFCYQRLADHFPVVLARVETRRVPYLGTIAWIPNGPVHQDFISPEVAIDHLKEELRRYDYDVLTQQAYYKKDTETSSQTIWVDLSQGLVELKSRVDNRVHYGVRRATRERVSISSTRSEHDIRQFFELCKDLSEKNHSSSQRLFS